jgi:hypothetical protein
MLHHRQEAPRPVEKRATRPAEFISHGGAKLAARARETIRHLGDKSEAMQTKRKPLETATPVSPPITKPKRKIVDEPGGLPVSKKTTVVVSAAKPCTLPGESIHLKSRGRIETQIRKKQEASVRLCRAFRAHDPPSTLYRSGCLPVVPERPLTRPIPFALHTDAHRKRCSQAKHRNGDEGRHCSDIARRHLQYTSSSEGQRCPSSESDEEAVSDTGFVFKARPAPKRAPFVPRKSTKPLTQWLGPRLVTETRASRREQFEEYLRRREQELERMRQRERACKENLEKEETLRLRRATEFKASAVRRYADVRPRLMARKITVPTSPQLWIAKRQRPAKS